MCICVIMGTCKCGRVVDIMSMRESAYVCVFLILFNSLSYKNANTFFYSQFFLNQDYL